MPALFIYLIKANIALTLFYLAYRFGLRRLTFYTLNRYFLLIGIAFSAIFPLVDINAFFQQHEQLAGSVTYYAVDWNVLQHYMMQQDPFTIWTLLQYVFWTGVAVMFIRFFIQLLSLFRIHLQSKNGKINNEKVKVIPGKINPFSFFKNIYINPSLHSPEELKTILVHEKIHVRQWHTLDVLTGEMNTIFYWFNPGAWLIKTAIRENLEFITDRKLVRSGINAKSYQYSLLRTVCDLHPTPLANNFNFSHLKQRIRMMNKKRSSPFHLLRYLLLLPIIAVVAFAVTASRGQDIQSKKSNAIVNLQKQNKDTVPLSENSKLPDDYNDFLRRNPSVKSLTWLIVPNEKGQGVNGYTKKNGKMEITKGRVGAVWVSLKNGRIEKYHFDNPDEMKKAEAKYGKFPSSWLPVPMPKPKVKYTPPKIIKDTTIKPQDKQDKGPKVKVHFTPPKIQTHTISNGNKPNTVTTFNKAYSIPTAMFVDTVPGNDSLAATLNPELDKALLIIDNKMRGIYDKVTNSAYLEKHFNPEDLSTISILKGKSAIEKYGEKGENGVIEIYTKNFVKKHPKWHPDTSATTAESKAGIIIDDRPIKSNPVYIVDGHVADSGFINQLKGKDIRSISVLKGTKAVSVYGKKAKDGAIIITTKEHAKKHRSF